MADELGVENRDGDENLKQATKQAVCMCSVKLVCVWNRI